MWEGSVPSLLPTLGMTALVLGGGGDNGRKDELLLFDYVSTRFSTNR